MTSMKIIQFSRPLPTPFVQLRPKLFQPRDLVRPISNEPPRSHFTFKLNTQTIGRFSPQTMPWYH